MARIRMLISGGQTGVDRAALDFALSKGLPYGGWVPQGGRAEDFTRPPGLLAKYPRLREHPSREWGPRTRANVRDSSHTLIVTHPRAPMGPGTKLTIRLAREREKPHLIVPSDVTDLARRFEEWTANVADDVSLNVAGSRESSLPGSYQATLELLEQLSPYLRIPQ